ncbi:MAG TPA: NAD(P)/FAD-dependent oxidoreductase [Gaiellaceae bacterium]
MAGRRVVVVGGGFGGLTAAKGLGRADVEVTLVDRQNFHLFQPLAYQVATGGLSPPEIAAPLRRILRRQQNTRVVLAEVSSFDLERHHVFLDRMPNGKEGASLEYDELVVAGGSAYSYFGHDEWAEHAPELKSLSGALELRTRILRAFEAAEVETDKAARRAWLTFVVVGAGPTGVEMAGQIGELARDALHRDFRNVDTRSARVLLVEAGPRVLGAFPEPLSHRAARALERLGVTVLVETTVVGVAAEEVSLRRPDGSTGGVPARTAIWAAGVNASPLAAALAAAVGRDVDRVGRLTVEPDLTLAGHPEVHAIGDMVVVSDGAGGTLRLPGVAPVAMQQGRYVARAIRGRSSGPFRYRDKGDLATIGRSRAVAVVKGVRLSGFPAWVIWLAVHITYLIGFENRLIVLTRWAFSYITRNRGARLIGQEEP